MANETDKFTRHAHYVERYKTYTANQIDSFLKRIDKYLRDQLSKAATISSRARLRELQKAVAAFIRSELREFQDLIESDLAKFALSEAQFSAKAIEGVVLSSVPSEAQLLAAIKSRPYATVLLRDDFADFTNKQIRLINNAMANGFFTGQTNGEILQVIRGTKANDFRDGILAVSKRQASSLVRTAVQHSSSVARNMLYEANDDLFTHYQWRSTLDSRTSPTCQELSNKVFRVGKGPLPPAHRNCRSTTVPVFDDELKTVDGELVRIGMRGRKQASMDGPVSANLSYGQWLRTQSAAFQDSVLGKERGKLFRDNKLPLDKFIENGKPIPLDDLKKRHKLGLSG